VRAWLPHTRSNTSNRALTFDTTVFPLVSQIDVLARRHLVGQQLSLDVIDPPGVGLPYDAALGSDGGTLWIVNAASNDVTVVDLESRRRVAHLEVADNPRGIVLAPDGDRVYVSNTLAGTVSVIDTAILEVIDEIAVTTLPLPPALLTGKRLFFSSDDPRLARAQWIACASCHFDGEHDGRTWTFGFAGPRNTTSLKGMVETYPLRWSAEWDESADSEFAITREQFGRGLLDGAMHPTLETPNTGRSWELDCLAAFLDSLSAPKSGPADLEDPDAVARGQELFFDAVTACADCHPPPLFTDLAVHDVGTADGPGERLGPEIDTPTLRDLARSAPYLHDGGADTLEHVLTTANPSDRHGVTSHLSGCEIADLVVYLLSLPGGATAQPAARFGGDGGSSTATIGGHLETVPSHGQTAVTGGTASRHGSDRRRAGHTVSGRVVSAATGAPIDGASVRVRATVERTLSDDSGRFRLVVPVTGEATTITAWSEGYHPAGVDVIAPQHGVTIALVEHPAGDNPDHTWYTSMPDPSAPIGCGHCMTDFPQWRDNAHGGAGTNPRFFSMYNGTIVDGYDTVSPSYKEDFPGTAGNCATCHAPGAAANRPFSADMNQLEGVETEGVFCDFCHKIGAVYLDPSTGLPYRNMPGVLSYRLSRPPSDTHMFFGPHDDVPRRVAYLELEKQSEFCAPCHHLSFWGTPIYTSFAEWLASPYSDPETGQTCQDCHMPRDGSTFFVPPELGGVIRPTETLPSHLQRGVGDRDLMERTLDLAVAARREGHLIDVTVRVTNIGAGHHVPTDHPGRHLLLLIEATDGWGASLRQLTGPVVPPWGGGLAGTPGTGYAKLLRDVVTGEWPVVSYWRQVLIVGDTRLPALASDITRYTFSAPSGDARITVRVVFRRLFEHLAARYRWPSGELTMAERTVELPGRR
jgi:YVTN family beta-propeller protein